MVAGGITYKCLKCKYEWTKHSIASPTPKNCPNCRTAYWNRPKPLIGQRLREKDGSR